MNEIKCPHCGTVFTVDEADYANLVNQVRTAEFEKELHARLAEADKAKLAEIALAEARATQQGQLAIAEREAEIQRLRADLGGADSARELAVTKVAQAAQATAAEKDAEIERLRADLKGAESARALAIAQIAQEAQAAVAEKDAQIQRLNGDLEKAATAEELAVAKAVSDAERRLTETKNQLALQSAEYKVNEVALKESHSNELALKDELIERYKDMKAKLSVKLLGETLEQHCETEFNRARSLAFPNASFGKDNDASGGTKGDYVFRDFSNDGVEYISIEV